MIKVMFVCYGGGHAKALIPVMRKMQSFDGVELCPIGINLAAEMIYSAGIPCKSLADYLDIEAVKIGFPLACERHNFSSKVPFADSIAYYGFTMGDLIDEVGEEVAEKILHIYDRRTMFPVRTMRRILEIEKPNVVVTTTMNRFEAAALYAAGLMGIPTLKVEDLIGKVNKTFPDKIHVDTVGEKEALISEGVRGSDIVLRSELEEPSVRQYVDMIHEKQLELRPTINAVVCEYAKGVLVNRGIPESSIVVTGQPAFDEHASFLVSTNKDAVCAELGVNPVKPVICFMSQPFSGREATLRLLIGALKQLDSNAFGIVLKLHPNEDGYIQNIIMNELDYHNMVIVKDVDPRTLIAISDVVITATSTTGIETAIMDKTLIYINATGQEDAIPYDKMGIGIRCTTADALMDAIKSFCFAKKETGLAGIDEIAKDGNASERIANLVMQIAL